MLGSSTATCHIPENSCIDVLASILCNKAFFQIIRMLLFQAVEEYINSIIRWAWTTLPVVGPRPSPTSFAYVIWSTVVSHINIYVELLWIVVHISTPFSNIYRISYVELKEQIDRSVLLRDDYYTGPSSRDRQCRYNH